MFRPPPHETLNLAIFATLSALIDLRILLATSIFLYRVYTGLPLLLLSNTFPLNHVNWRDPEL